MKNVLNYQSSEYDCGPTTLTNALRYLFERCDIPPELLKAIALYTLDAYNEEGETGRSGTSAMAMQFLASWFEQFGRCKKIPDLCQLFSGRAGSGVSQQPHRRLSAAGRRGGHPVLAGRGRALCAADPGPGGAHRSV